MLIKVRDDIIRLFDESMIPPIIGFSIFMTFALIGLGVAAKLFLAFLSLLFWLIKFGYGMVPDFIIITG